MIPYFQIPALQLGRGDQSFGVLVAAGIYLASRLIERQAIRRGLRFVRSSTSCPGASPPCDRRSSVHLFFYHPEELHGPWEHGRSEGLDGLSSTAASSGRPRCVAYFRCKGLSCLSSLTRYARRRSWMAVARLVASPCMTPRSQDGLLAGCRIS